MEKNNYITLQYLPGIVRFDCSFVQWRDLDNSLPNTVCPVTESPVHIFYYSSRIKSHDFHL